jgi:leucyl-tRNA synthetase
LPTEDGDPPLARAENFNYTPKGETQAYPLEMSTMPGWAGSSWYWYRYMDAKNDTAFVDKDTQEYWENVDLYIGGSEHATGHLLYSRFWNKVLFDLGIVNQQEPFKKLINQGMIQGRSNFVYRINIVDYGVKFSLGNSAKTISFPPILISKTHFENINSEETQKMLITQVNQLASAKLKEQGITLKYITAEKFNWTETSKLHVDVNIVHNDELDMQAFRNWRPDLANAQFITEENGKYICGWEVEKMSKSKYNVVSPDDIIERYGADTLRLYEMFLGPLEQFKPWNTNGIDGVSKFLKKLWRLYHDKEGNFSVNDAEPTKAELKTLHKTIKKAEEDVDRYSFNTSVSNFMICVNELTAISCNNRAILSDLAIVISPYAPHISEELWQLLGHTESIATVPYPQWNAEFLKEDDFEYPVAFNGKMRVKLSFPVGTPVPEIQAAVLADKSVQKWLEGKAPKKVIVVPNKIVNIVV